MARRTRKGDIATYVLDLIARKPLAPGDQIPSERDLMLAFGVTRETVRRAVEGLVSDGVVVKQQGLGTFVASPNTGPEGSIVDFELVRLRRIEALARELFTLEDERGQMRASALDRDEERDEVEIEMELRALLGFAESTEPEVQHQRDCPHPVEPCDCRRSHLLAEGRRLAAMIVLDVERPEGSEP